MATTSNRRSHVPPKPDLSTTGYDRSKEKTPPAQRIEKPQGVQEVVVISGKGGTGKTSILSSFFALSENKAVVADCDVDAADLYLVVKPTAQDTWSFSGGEGAIIDEQACTGCGLCFEHCRFDAIVPIDDGQTYRVDQTSCEGCGVCVDVCPVDAARLVPRQNGQWFVSQTRHGPMVHARLGIAEENSGKLVSVVRTQAKAMAAIEGRSLVLVDGPPGVGCPVISSVTGASFVVVVSEPTLSGLHDMERVAELTDHFKIKTGLCINKADLNPDMSDRLEQEATKRGLPVLGRIHYHESVVKAQLEEKTVVELQDSPVAEEIRAVWKNVLAHLDDATS
ncbi:MAG: ATP-binding protein [Deltaproteobacteria bacterium]|nr:ATP-binding protein [Deltaproteobacteria bacterium]